MTKTIAVITADVHELCRQLARVTAIVSSDGRMSRETKIAINRALLDAKKIAGSWVQLSMFSGSQLSASDSSPSCHRDNLK